VTSARAVEDLLDRADAARAAGRGEDAARLYAAAIDRCRETGDLAGWTRAALGAAGGYVFGAEPGRLPAQLHELLDRTTDDADHARLGAALARCWAYAGRADRAARFAAEAVDRAEQAGSAEVLADALDAALAAHWGPDDLEVRVSLAGRLDDVAAHLLEPDARLQARLWGLQVACEALDLPAVHRHMRAIELLGEESPRARFFAASRRLMLDLLRGRTDTAPALIDSARAAGEHAGLADAWMVVGAMTGHTAAQTGDSATCGAIAAEMERFAEAEGAAAVLAEAAAMWACAGDHARVRRLVRRLTGRVLADLPRDVNWLLTLQCTLEGALAVDEGDVVESAALLLAPYEGRAVFNAGAVSFQGVTDDPLSRAAAARGDVATAERLRTRALATYDRLGARWWRDRLLGDDPRAGTAPATPPSLRLQPLADGLWLIGMGDLAVPVRSVRGFGYLRELLRHPGVSVSALELVSGGTGTVDQPAVGERLDRTAVEAYRRRLQEIETDLAEADEWADLGRRDAVLAEREALIAELSAAAGLGGRPRPDGSTQERARVAATKAINLALARISAVDEPLGRHLRESVHTGRQCSYDPAPDVRLEWQLD
jgi:tetratricopeptide (TPR) repeat protein